MVLFITSQLLLSKLELFLWNNHFLMGMSPFRLFLFCLEMCCCIPLLIMTRLIIVLLMLNLNLTNLTLMFCLLFLFVEMIKLVRDCVLKFLHLFFGEICTVDCYWARANFDGYNVYSENPLDLLANYLTVLDVVELDHSKNLYDKTVFSLWIFVLLDRFLW